MNFQIVKPPEYLSDVVRCFWMFESDKSTFKPRVFQSMADGYGELIFQYGGGFAELKKTPFYLRMAKSDVKQFTLSENAGMFGVRFFPNAIPELLKIPSVELINGVYDAKELLGDKARLLEDQLAGTSMSKKVELMSAFLGQLLRNRDQNPMTLIIKEIIKSEGQVSIRALQQSSRYSERHFERKFTACAGFAPKQFSRIIRFQNAKQKYATGRYRNLSELALASNYFDQSHFIREFKEFSGLHPKKYFRIFDDIDGDESKILKGLVLGKDMLGK